jgi:hypothetical protein
VVGPLLAARALPLRCAASTHYANYLHWLCLITAMLTIYAGLVCPRSLSPAAHVSPTSNRLLWTARSLLCRFTSRLGERGAAAAGVLRGAWYGFAVAPRRTSSGHALHVCATGAIASCAPGRFALGQTRSGLGVWVASPATWERCFESSRYFTIPGDGAAAAAGGGRRGQEKANGFLPPLAANCSDVMSCLDL